MGKIRIGVSGWDYDEWRGDFYPEGLPHDHRLRFAAGVFDTIEINGTFYSLTDPATCRSWREAVPAGFRYSLKGSRYITHNKRMRDAREALANFFASGILELGESLGPILWQLPGNLEFDAGRLDAFLAMLPHDSGEAVALAKAHDERVEDVSYGNGESHRIRHVLEFRHESFLQAETISIARRHHVALCFSHSDQWPYVEDVTAGFVYLRLHGPRKLYASAYGEEVLEHWARKIEKWRDGDEPGGSTRISDRAPPRRAERDVYVYFDNTAHGHAPREARQLIEIVN